MNASEKRICATPALMQLDLEMGQLARRAEPHQDGFNSEQRRFRQALKTCKGDQTCLTASYQNRIAELQAFVNTLDPPTQAEAIELASEADKAQERRDSQADTREKIAERVDQADAIAAAPVGPEPPEAIEQATAQTEAVQEEVPVEPVATTQPVEPQSSGAGWGTLAALLLVAALMVYGFVTWLFAAVRRCPNCTKWWAGQIYDQDRTSHTDYETKTFEDVHRDKNYAVVGRTTRKQQVAVRVSNTTNYLRCQKCNHEWTHSYSRRRS